MEIINIDLSTSNNDKSCAVTELGVTPDNVNSGSKVEINISFSDKNCSIEPGDKIEVTWPSKGEAYLQGFNQTFPLIDKNYNVVLANVTITNGSAEIVFTGNVKKLNKITGSVKFKALAWNLSQGVAENKKTVSIVSGTKTVPITIIKPEYTNDDIDFYSKTGSIWPNDTNHIYWYLNTNITKENLLKSIDIIDEVQPGQEIVDGSFMIYNTSNHEYYEGYNSIGEFENAHPNSYIKYDIKQGTVNVVLDPSTVNGINWIIVFKTIIIDKNKASFENNSSINYWPESAPGPKNLGSNALVNNLDSDGDISGVPQSISIEVNKEWIDNNNQDGIRLNEVTVILKGNGEQVGQPVELKEGQWSYTWSNLPEYANGEKINYTVEESPLEGYETSYSQLENGTITITNTHKPQETSVEVKKVWVDNNNQDGIRPSSITVTLKGNGQQIGQPVELKGEQWSYTWSNLPEYANGEKINYTV